MLPHELRDLIYQDFQPPTGDVSVFTTALGEVSFVDNERFYNIYEVYEWDIGYLGAGIMRELVRPWYSCSTFVFERERSIGNYGCGLTQFLATDFWSTGLQLSALLQDLVIHVDDFYFSDLPNTEFYDESGSSSAQERREYLCLGLRGLIPPKSSGARINIVLYTTPLSQMEDGDFELSILQTGLETLLPVLGKLQMTGWKINLTMTGFHELHFSPLFDWLKDLPYVGDWSVTKFVAIIESFFRVSRA
jgi:hypothetical protein